MASVSFFRSFVEQHVDVVIIVSHHSGNSFVEEKIKEIVGVIPSNFSEKVDDLSYRKIHSFDLVVAGKLVQFIVAGAGHRNDLTSAGLKKLGGYIYNSIKSKNGEIILHNNVEATLNDAAAFIVSGLELKSWTFDKYKTKKDVEKMKTIKCQTSYVEMNQYKYTEFSSTKSGTFLVRNLVTEPANVMVPQRMLLEAENLAKFEIKVNCIEKKDMEKMGINAILGVGQGSDLPTYLITMEYGDLKNTRPIALVGKGVTFDAGGLCLKPSSRMGEMKGDMTGAAVVIGAMQSLAAQKIQTSVIGVIGVAENVISGSAQRPGDVIVSMSGKTIEIDNTDAEGRLILADLLWYTQERFMPKAIVDFATLTGAIQVALGNEFAGLFSNDRILANALIDSGRNVGEKLWEFPLHESYDDYIKSDIADVTNSGIIKGAGSITAAMFLKHFIKKETKWAHIDIAATEWDARDRALSQKGATGFGVALIDDFIKKYDN